MGVTGDVLSFPIEVICCTSFMEPVTAWPFKGRGCVTTAARIKQIRLIRTSKLTLSSCSQNTSSTARHVIFQMIEANPLNPLSPLPPSSCMRMQTTRTEPNYVATVKISSLLQILQPGFNKSFPAPTVSTRLP